MRLAWLSAALGTVAIALGLMAMAAMRARDEAERQRTQAEGLIAFMLGDLRKRLDPVGRLDVLDAVGARALQYYAHQDPRAGLIGDSARVNLAEHERALEQRRSGFGFDLRAT